MKWNIHKLVSTQVKRVAAMLLVVMVGELIYPLKAFALTSGPTQPEFQGFTPLATTSLVDPFSGDFSYNIPLLDIDGYPLNLVYRGTSNIEEEGSWVGYGWNVNVGTLNRFVRGLPDDMNGGLIKSYQNIKERTVNSVGVSFEPSFGVHVGDDGIGATAGFQNNMGFTYDEDNYTGVGVGLSVGCGVYVNVNAGPFSVGGNAGVTSTANSSTGGSISTYAGFNAGLAYGDYFSVGFGKSVNRTFNTISGWEYPNVVGSFNICNITREVQKSFISSISNEVPQITNPYRYYSDGMGYKLNAGFSLGIIEELGIDMGMGITVTTNKARTTYEPNNVHAGYGYMYSENAKPADMLDFTRDNDGGINKDMPFVPPAMKTYDVFSSTAHNASSTFRADRNDFGVVRDPQVNFQNTDQHNEMNELDIKGYMSFTCWMGISIHYYNSKTSTEGSVTSGGCPDDLIASRKTNGKDQNLFFKACGATSQADEGYLDQVKRYGSYRLNTADSVKGITSLKRQITPEPIAVYTNNTIGDLPQTVISKKLQSYAKNSFPTNSSPVSLLNRTSSASDVEDSKIGAILNTNKSGQTYVYATPVNNNIKNEVAFRANGFNDAGFRRREGWMPFSEANAPLFNGEVRDNLYKNTLSPSYATSYLLNAVLSPDYVDVANDGITDDDMGSFVKFNYTKAENDYRWRVPYSDSGENIALLNEGVKVTKFDDVGSYMIGSKQLWYAHSIESKNYVVEFYLSDREDALDTRNKIIRADHPFASAVSEYTTDKNAFAHMQKLDSVRYYYKHDRYINKTNAVPLKTIYFDYDYGISSNMPNSATHGGKLRLLKVRMRHGNEPLEFAETYNFGYTGSNPAYNFGEKEGWGNYCPNNRPLPLCEFPYIDQEDRLNKDANASAFHMNAIQLPSGGKINVEYEADDYAYVQDKRAMALKEVAGVGASSSFTGSDVDGLYSSGLQPFLYIYVPKPPELNGNYKSFLLNNTDLMYFSFNVNIAGNAFSKFDQVKGYAQVEAIEECPNDHNYLYIKVQPIDLTGTRVSPSPMTNTAINMARAFASDQLFFQEQENSDGRNRNHVSRLAKAARQVAEAIFAQNSIKELMQHYRAGQKFIKSKSYVKLAMAKPKIGGGSRVSRLTFDDEWNNMTSGESSSLVGYHYIYQDKQGLSSGVASYEPTLGGEENPKRSGASYALSNNRSTYPPYDPIELVKEDPVGESFYPTGSVGYSRIVIESIHKGYARSAQSRLVQEFYTAKDFPYFSSFGPKDVSEVKDKDYPNPGIRDILLSFIGGSQTESSSRNAYDIKQDFVIETNDMHGKPKATFNYRLLPQNGREELVNATEYYYNTNGYNRLSNEVDVIQHISTGLRSAACNQDGVAMINQKAIKFPESNMVIVKKSLGVDIDVCADSRQVESIETRNMKKRGGGVKVCIPPSIRPSFSWVDATHVHTDYFKSTATTKIISRYGILKGVRNYKEGAETIVENKYYDAVTGEAVVQVVKDKFGDNIYTTNVPAYWTKTDLEPSYLDYPFMGNGTATAMPSQLLFGTTGNGYLAGSNLIQASFTTGEDIFHQGDEVFVRSQSNKDTTVKWYRLYVADVLVKKNHYGAPDPLEFRYGNGPSTGADYMVSVTPYKVNNPASADLGNGDKLMAIQGMFRYRSGRKNMLDASAGSYLSTRDPFVVTDSIVVGIGKGNDTSWCNIKLPAFLRAMINATATRYSAVNSLPNGSLNNLTFNPVSAGILNQPYVAATYALSGNRKDQSASMQQRANGVLNNWYYWLPARYYDPAVGYQPRKALMTHYDDPEFEYFANGNGNAGWFTASQVTKSLPSVGPVEETNPLGIYSSVLIEPTTKRLMHATANGKFGQTWVETFEDLQQLRKYNTVTDLFFSPFQKSMSRSAATATGYEVFNKAQTTSGPDVSGSFTLNDAEAHTGMYSLYVSSGTATVKVTPKKYTGTASYYSNLFDFNLDAATQKYTVEVWANGGANPGVNSGGVYTSLSKASPSIDGWFLYRATVNVSENSQVTFSFPGGQSYDDLRVYPSSSNIKTYVYHPFRTYLMAVLDENNFATFYEYNNRNQLIRLKKETEKGIITTTENIKHTVSR